MGQTLRPLSYLTVLLPVQSLRLMHLIDPLPSKGHQTCKYLAFSASIIGGRLCLM